MVILGLEHLVARHNQPTVFKLVESFVVREEKCPNMIPGRSNLW